MKIYFMRLKKREGSSERMEEGFTEEMTSELDPNRYVGMGGRQFQAEGAASEKAQKSRMYGCVANSEYFCMTRV